MNAFGIDYQQALSVICLREGYVRLRSVGDGASILVPNVATPEGLWGTSAARALAGGDGNPGDQEANGAINGLAAEQFWEGLARRLSAYLGRMRPTARNGYRIVVALPLLTPSSKVAVERLSRHAGLEDVICINATDAILARWLAERAIEGPAPRAVTAVVVADNVTTVRGYQLNYERGRIPHVVWSTPEPRTIAGGYAGWIMRTLELVQQRLREPVGPGYALALRDAAFEFGARLRLAAPGEAVEWTGLLAERLYQPLRLSRQECRTWSDVSSVTLALPAAIQEAARPARGASAELILVGGVGGVWPFAADAAASIGGVWQSPGPAEDVARGAAWWPEMALYFDTGAAVGPVRESPQLAESRTWSLPESPVTVTELDEPAKTEPKLSPEDKLPPSDADADMASGSRLPEMPDEDSDLAPESVSDWEQLPPWERRSPDV